MILWAELGPRPGVSLYTIIIQVDGKIRDFISFYALPSTVMHHPVHKKLNAAYAFYMATTSVTREKLVHDALIIAKEVCPKVV